MRLKISVQYDTSCDEGIEINVVLDGVSSEEQLAAVQEFLRRVKWGVEKMKEACPPVIRSKPIRLTEEPIEFDGQV